MYLWYIQVARYDNRFETREMLTGIPRVTTCLTDNGHGTPHHAKVGDFYGDRYTMLANGGHEPCMELCGMNTTKGHNLCPPLRKPPPSPRMRAIDIRSSHMTLTDTTYHQTGTCGLRVMDQRSPKTSFLSRIDSRKRYFATGRRNMRPGPLYQPYLPAGADMQARADKGSPTWVPQGSRWKLRPRTKMMRLRRLTRLMRRGVAAVPG
jgi:hypothetical protein